MPDILLGQNITYEFNNSLKEARDRQVINGYQESSAILQAGMPEAWKAERRALWDSDAAESKWRWKFQQDPDTAVRQMKGITVDAKGLSNAIQQTAEQLGVNPVDLATVMREILQRIEASQRDGAQLRP